MKTANIATTLGALLLAAGARAGTVTVQGNQTVEGSQLVQSNQTVAGSLTSQGSSAEVAATRFRAFGPVGSTRWIKLARIGGADLTNAVMAGRLLVRGTAPGNQYVADFAFPGPGQNPYSPVLVEMGGGAASGLVWEVRSSGADYFLWFGQAGGSGFANFLYGEAGCVPLWETNASPSGTLVWRNTTATDSRQSLKAGGLTLTKGLTLPDGTLLNARSNMTATALINPANGQKLLEVASGRLRFTGPSDFLGSIGLGTNGLAITADAWAAVESGLVDGRGAKPIAGAGAWAISGMAEDGSGNRYAYGYFAGSMDAGGAILRSGASENDRAGFVIKIDSLGGVAWGRAFALVNHSANGQQNENLVQIAGAVVAASGDVILAGTFRATADFAGSTNSPSGGGDGFVVSLRPDGTPAWFRKFGGSQSVADALVNLAVDAGGTNLVAGGSWANAGDTDGYAVLLATSNGATLGAFTLSGDPAGGPDIATSVTRVCFSGDAPVVAWEGGDDHCITNLAAGGWGVVDQGPVSDMQPDIAGNVVVFEADEPDEYLHGVGRVRSYSASDGSVLWTQMGFSSDWSTSWDVYDEWGNWVGTEWEGGGQGWSLQDFALDRSGTAWFAWHGWEYYSSPSYSYSYEYDYLRRGGSDAADMGQSFSVCADASGDIHALAYVGGNARDVRFDGQSGAQEADSLVGGASGTLLGASQSAHSLVVASAGAIAQDSDWSASVSVDGLLAAGSGILLGDGTVVATSEDIAALGPVQSGGGGNYFVMGSVGIGTDAPAYGLDVSGDARITGPLSLGQNLEVGGALSAAGGSLSGGLTVGGDAHFFDSSVGFGEMLGTGVPGFHLVYEDGGWGVIRHRASRWGASWLWEHACEAGVQVPQMELDGCNRIRLFGSATNIGPAAIILDPGAGNDPPGITIPGSNSVVSVAGVIRIPAAGDIPMGAFTNGPAQ
jgi:hypothetical protein